MNTAVLHGPLRLLAGRRMTVAILVYLSILLCLRIILFPGSSEDDAEQLFYAQSWALGYKGNQPPLFTWLVMALRDTGVSGIATVLTVKFGALAVFYLSFLGAARHLIPASAGPERGDDQTGTQGMSFRGRESLLAVLALPACFFIGWDAINNYTHSILLAAAMSFTLWAMVRLMKSDTWFDYGLVATGITVGFLSKYNFVFFFACLMISALAHPDLRPRILSRRFLAALGMVAILIAPPIAWFLTDPNGLTAVSGAGAMFPDASSRLSAAGQGLSQLAIASLGFLSPLLPLALAFLTPAFGRLPQQGSTARRNGRFLEVYFLTLMIGIAATILISGATDVRNNWLMVLFPFPIYLMLRVRAAQVSERRLAGFAVSAFAIAWIVPVALIARGLTAPEYCKKCNFFQPYAELAVALEERGFNGGTIVTVDYPNQLGGNLKRFFSDSRIVSSRWRDYVPPLQTGADGQCLMIWSTARGGGGDEAATRAWDALAASARPDDTVGEIALPLPGNRDRSMIWGFRLGEGRGGCR